MSNTKRHASILAGILGDPTAMPTPSEPVTPVRLAGLSVRFGDHWALREISFEFAPGRTYALIGPSGCGKSTLLRCVCGLTAPTAGNITLGHRALDRGALTPLRHRMGYVIQEGGLFPHLTALENLTLMPRYLGWSATKTRNRVHELTDLARLSAEQLRRFPSELSGGQRQRIGVLRALMLDPDLLLLDEPLGALDPLIRVRLQEELKQLFATLGKTVLFVTHDLTEAHYLGDILILLSEGRVVQSGRLHDLRETPASPFVTQFLRAHRTLDAIGGPP